MATVIKISTDFTDVKAQILNPRDLNYIQELRSFNECKFTISINDPQVDEILKFRKIQIYSIENEVDSRVWTGYISKIEYSFFDIFITCSDEKRYVYDKKQFFEDKSFSAITVSSVLKTMVDEVNERTNQIEGLKSHYNLDDNLATTNVIDSFGSEDGTAEQNTENMSREDGSLNEALLFNGTTDFVTLSSASNFSIVDSSFTISAWVNLASISGNKTILGMETAVANESLALYLNDGKPVLGFFGDDLESTTVLEIGKWYHITFMFDKPTGTQSIYIDGVLDISTNGHSAMTGTSTLFIGQWHSSPSDKRMHGMIDEVRIYNTTKTQSQIDELYHGFGYKNGVLTYETNLTDTLTRDYIKGTSYSSVFSDFENEFNCEIDVVENNIIVKDTIGEDKSSGSGLVELISNIDSPNENNITNFVSLDNGEEIITSLIGKDDTTYSDSTNNTELYGFIEGSELFNDGDLANQVTEYLAENSEAKLVFDIEVSPNVDFKTMNIGDIIKLRIERNSNLLDVEAGFKVIYKEVSFKNASAQYSIKLSQNPTKILNAQNYFSKIAERLKRQELQ